ncbi:unnamed protein product [Durusdinium trenchii]|uniref:Kinesin motor domain-containing protein n=1 Tax=Durusdinium trenchii TaxID=1381693 RepID=A0ABP0I9Y4_9DINO
MAPPERHVPAASPLHAVRVAVANLRGEARAAALAAAPAVRRASSLGQLNAELAAAAARLGQGSAIEVAPGATPSSVSVTFRPEDGCHLVAGAGYEASPGLTSAVSLRVDGTPAAATAEDAPPLHVSAEGRFCFEEDALRCSLKASPARVDGMPCIPSLQLGLGLGGVLGFMRPFGTHTCGQLVFSDLLGRHALKLGASSRDLRPRKDETAFLELPLQTSKTALSYQFLSSSASSRSAVFAEISGLLGDVKVARCETSYQHGGEALGGRWRVSGMLGVAQPLGETTLPWEERFFLGGSFGAQRLMGFGPHGLGPTAYTERESKARLGLVQGLGGLGLQRSGPIIEKTRSSFMGGDSCASLEALMQFPLGPLQLMTFGAAGLLVNRSQVASLPDLTGSLRASFGAGIGYPLPGGGHIAATFTLPVQAVEGPRSDRRRYCGGQELPRTAEPEQEEQVGISQMQVYQLRPHGWWWAPLRSTDPISLVQELQARIEDLEEAVQQELSLAMLEKLEEAFSRLQLADDAREHEQKDGAPSIAMQQKTSQLQEEVEFLRSAKFEADDRCQQLEVELKQAKNSVSAQALQLESQFRESQMEQLQAVDQARGEAEAYQRRAKMAEAQLQTAQAAAERFSTEFYQLEARFAEEQLIRKKYHNQIQDMKGSVRVFCRFRPLAKREEDLGDIPVLHKADAFSVDLQRLAPHNDTRRFDFDAVFGGDSPQEEVFRDCEDLVQSVVDGYNVTIFAYGQTGAGKTHTMYGTHDHPGLAPRSIDSLFHLIHREERQGRKSFTVKAYMIELYKQEILDLLVEARRENSKEKQLQIKKDAGRGIMFVEGVCERQIHGPDELKAVLAEGERRRHTAATAMNTSSSRSHLLLSIIVEATAKDNDQVIYGKITLCDLAGSERLKKSEVSGDALKEAIEINKSLTALGDVIEALSKGSKNVPYRNHKLTMLMQDSLGGSAKTLMFVNCSPASSNAEETLTSLKWATRAKQVTNDVKRNADCKEVARLKQVIAMMSQAQSAEEPLRREAPGGIAS